MGSTSLTEPAAYYATLQDIKNYVQYSQASYQSDPEINEMVAEVARVMILGCIADRIPIATTPVTGGDLRQFEVRGVKLFPESKEAPVTDFYAAFAWFVSVADIRLKNRDYLDDQTRFTLLRNLCKALCTVYDDVFSRGLSRSQQKLWSRSVPSSVSVVYGWFKVEQAGRVSSFYEMGTSLIWVSPKRTYIVPSENDPVAPQNYSNQLRRRALEGTLPPGRSLTNFPDSIPGWGDANCAENVPYIHMAGLHPESVIDCATVSFGSFRHCVKNGEATSDMKMEVKRLCVLCRHFALQVEWDGKIRDLANHQCYREHIRADPRHEYEHLGLARAFSQPTAPDYDEYYNQQYGHGSGMPGPSSAYRY